MARFRLELPVLQQWSCHNCGGCCRQHLIEVTEEERTRIEQQQWTAADGVTIPPIVRMSKGWFGPPRYRLAHQADGSCVFLTADGRCRIHAKFGEAAKPWPCRIYPYAFHPGDRRLMVGMRFSCPSVVKNQGTPVSAQLRELQPMAEHNIPAGADELPPPKITSQTALGWREFAQIVAAVDGMLANPTQPLILRLQRLALWTQLINDRLLQQFAQALPQNLSLLRDMTEMELPRLGETPVPVSAMGRLYFRVLSALYARKDTVADLSSGWRGRWRLLRSYVAMIRGRGMLPAFQPDLRPLHFQRLETSAGPLTAEMQALLTRYLRTKLSTYHFCGRAFYDLPLVDGLNYLVLTVPITLWLTRWLAAADNQSSWQLSDLERGLAIVDHNHGFSPAIGTPSAQSRVRWLAASGELGRLCDWYGR